MIILSTAVLYYVISKSGYTWEGIVAAWVLASLADVGLFGFLIYRLTK